MSELFDPIDRSAVRRASAVPDPSATEPYATEPYATEQPPTGRSEDTPSGNTRSRNAPSPSSTRFARAVDALRSPDPLRRETGFDFLREHADAYIDDLVAEFESASGAAARGASASEPDGRDAAPRGLLLELICEARSPRSLPVLVEQLAGEDDELRFWAARGLEMLDSREAHQALERAHAEGLII
jgi:hypothetical protein